MVTTSQLLERMREIERKYGDEPDQLSDALYKVRGEFRKMNSFQTSCEEYRQAENIYKKLLEPILMEEYNIERFNLRLDPQKPLFQ